MTNDLTAPEIYDPVEGGKDYIVQIKVRNGPLLRALRSKGWTASELSRRSGVPSTRIGEYLALKIAPIVGKGRWSGSVLKMAHALGMLPDDLFPPQHLNLALKRSTGEFEVSRDDLAQMLAPPDAASPERLLLRAEVLSKIEQSLALLTPRQERVLRMRFGLNGSPEMTLEEIGDQFSLSKDRIRQIEAKALRHLGHPRRGLHHSDVSDLVGDEAI